MDHNNFSRKRRRDMMNMDMSMAVVMSKMPTMMMVVRKVMMVGYIMCQISSVSSVFCLMVLHICPSLQERL